MSRRLLLALGLAACTAAHDGTGAARDAAGTTPDAAPSTPDATPRVPDAAPPADGGLPDAAPAADALPGDAAAPDAAPPDCPDARRYFRDRDGDGAGDPGDAVIACDAPPGFVTDDGDCDDADPAVRPDGAERCNGLDDDCDGRIDDDAADATPWFTDADGDGFGDPTQVTYACQPPAGAVGNDVDCNDGTATEGDCAAGTFCSHAGRCLPAGACGDSRDCDRDHVCGDDGRCVPGSLCGGQSFASQRVRPDLLLVLDRSCSMRQRVGGVRKWQAAVDAIDGLTREFDDQLRFGLVLFPDTVGNQCRQGDIPIPLGDGNGPPIRDLLRRALDDMDPNWPDGPCVTNIDSGVAKAATDPALADPARPHYLMLITDGEQAGCSADGGNDGTVRTLEALDHGGVSTFVVGFGAEVSAQWLTRFSDAGGVPRAGDPRYHQADDAPALLATLRDIAGQVTSCEFRLDAVPPDPLDLAAFFDREERVPRDAAHQQGWDYDPATNAVTFFGPACERLRQHQVADVDIVFGCAY
jgi:hypothetical protein